MKLNRNFNLATGCLAAGVILLSTSASRAQTTPPKTPVGPTWDCLVSGAQGRGIAFVTFHEDWTFDGYSLLTANNPVPSGGGSTSTNPRGDSTDVGRGDSDASRGTTTTSGTGTTTTTTTTGTPYSTGTTTAASKNVYGFGPVAGKWQYDLAGRTIGFFYQVIADNSNTNAEPVYSTNAIWFRATVIPNRSLSMVVTSPGGKKTTFAGLPLRTMSDLSGQWYANMRGTGQKVLEFFEMAPTEQYGVYELVGQGPTYTTSGWAMLSSRKRIGFAFYSSENSTVRSTVGTFYPGMNKALTTGVMDPGYNVTFNAFHYPIPTY